MKLHAYKNLHRMRGGHADTWSLRSPATRTVVGYAAHVELVDVTFRVQAAGRRAVLRDGIRRVHAYVVGEVVARRARRAPRQGRWVRFTYRAKTAGFFITTSPENPRPILAAARVRLDRDGAFCQEPVYGPPLRKRSRR